MFVRDPARNVENGGWLLSYRHDLTADRTTLVVIDAADLAAGPIAEVLIPHRIPFGFHATWHEFA